MRLVLFVFLVIGSNQTTASEKSKYIYHESKLGSPRLWITTQVDGDVAKLVIDCREAVLHTNTRLFFVDVERLDYEYNVDNRYQEAKFAIVKISMHFDNRSFIQRWKAYAPVDGLLELNGYKKVEKLLERMIRADELTILYGSPCTRCRQMHTQFPDACAECRPKYEHIHNLKKGREALKRLQNQCRPAQLLLDAACASNESTVERLVADGVNVNSADKHGWTPIHYAALTGDVVLAQRLVALGAHIDQQDADGFTPLHIGILTNKLNVVRFLLESGAQVDLVGSKDQRALHLAASRGAVDTIKLLLARGVNLNLRDAQSKTPLAYAVQRVSVDVVSLLLANGAEVNTATTSGVTPLHLAAHGRWVRKAGSSLKIVKALLQAGADVDPVDSDGATPLYRTVVERMEPRRPWFKTPLCSSKPGVFIIYDIEGSTEVMSYTTTEDQLRAEREKHDIATTLLLHGGNPSHQTKTGDTLRAAAIRNKREDILGALRVYTLVVVCIVGTIALISVVLLKVWWRRRGVK